MLCFPQNFKHFFYFHKLQRAFYRTTITTLTQFYHPFPLKEKNPHQSFTQFLLPSSKKISSRTSPQYKFFGIKSNEFPHRATWVE